MGAVPLRVEVLESLKDLEEDELGFGRVESGAVREVRVEIATGDTVKVRRCSRVHQDKKADS